MFKELTIELTNACSARCIMCLRKQSKRPIVHMDLGLLKKIMDEIVQNKYCTPEYPLGICGVGDPVLHPEFDKALDLIAQVPFGCGTNCHDLTQDKSESIISHGFSDITLSLDAMTPETHAQIRRGLDFYRCVANARGFIQRLREVPPRWRAVYIQMILNPLNIHEMDDFIHFWRKEAEDLPGVKVFIKPMCIWPGITESSKYYPSPKLERENGNGVIYGPFAHEMRFRETCNLFNGFVQIQSDGTYSPCCMNPDDEFQVGNVKDSTIMELYQGERMKKLRELFASKNYEQIPFCKNCI